MAGITWMLNQRVGDVAAKLMQEWDIVLGGQPSLTTMAYILIGKCNKDGHINFATRSLSWFQTAQASNLMGLITNLFMEIIGELGAKPKAKGGAYDPKASDFAFSGNIPKNGLISSVPSDELCDKLNATAEQVMYTTGTNTPIMWEEIEAIYKQMVNPKVNAPSSPIGPAKPKPPQKLNSIADLYQNRPWMEDKPVQKPEPKPFSTEKHYAVLKELADKAKAKKALKKGPCKVLVSKKVFGIE